MAKPLTDEEVRVFFDLLERYCATELDQWDLWRTETDVGPVYVHLSRKPIQGATAGSYEAMP